MMKTIGYSAAYTFISKVSNTRGPPASRMELAAYTFIPKVSNTLSVAPG